jgi:hypothetical protein
MKGYMPDSYMPGASLRAWRDFFRNGSVHGIDVQPDCLFSEERITTHLCDSTNAESCRTWSKAHALTFDEPAPYLLDTGTNAGLTSFVV